MKPSFLLRVVPVFLVLIAGVVASAHRESNVENGFVELSDFLVWADEGLARDDYESLAKGLLTEGRLESQLWAIEQIDTRLGEQTLSEVFKGREFPEEGQTFKLGGHFKELHCGHIDFVKSEGRWFLRRIWQCR